MSCGFGNGDPSASKTPRRDFQGLWSRLESSLMFNVHVNLAAGPEYAHTFSSSFL